MYATYTKNADGSYEVLDGEKTFIGTVEKTRRRTQVMANDGGRNILVGHTERTAWKATTATGEDAGNYHSTRGDAAHFLGYLNQTSK